MYYPRWEKIITFGRPRTFGSFLAVSSSTKRGHDYELVMEHEATPDNGKYIKGVIFFSLVCLLIIVIIMGHSEF